MKQYTLYKNGIPVDQIQVYGSDNAPAPAGYIETTGQTYDLEAAKEYKSAEVSAHAKRLRDHIVRNISAGELASWPIKLAEAAKYAQTGQDADAPMLAAEAAARGITLAELVAKVGGNATTFAGLEAAIAGADGAHRDAIKACETFEAVAAYDFSTGWPGV